MSEAIGQEIKRDTIQTTTKGVDFLKKIHQGIKYRYKVRTPDTPWQPSLTSSSTVSFEIPNIVHNHHNSNLEIGFRIPAQGANRFAKIRTEFPALINRITLKTEGNQTLEDLKNLNYFTKISLKPTHKLDDFKTYPLHQTGFTNASETNLDDPIDSVIANNPVAVTEANADSADPGGGGVNAQVNGVLNTLVAEFNDALDVIRDNNTEFDGEPLQTRTSAQVQEIGQFFAPSRRRGGDATATVGDLLTPVAQYSAINESGTQNFITSDAVNQPLYVKALIPMSLFTNSYFEIDKCLKYGETLRLDVEFAPIIDWGFKCSEVNKLDANVEVLTDAAAAADTVAANSYVRYHIAYPDSPIDSEIISNDIMTKGVTLKIPRVESIYLGNTTGTAGDVLSFQRKMNATKGEKLRHAWVGVFHNDEEKSTKFGIYNVGSLTHTSIRTYLDNRALQDQPLVVGDGYPYMWLKEMLKGSVIQSQRHYNENAFWLDDFCGLNRSTDIKLKADNDMGLPLNVERTYQVDITSSAVVKRIYLFLVYQRNVEISAMGVREY